MTEDEYIVVTNLAKIRVAQAVMRDVMPGFDGVITDNNLHPIIRGLIAIEDALRKKIKIMEKP